MKLIVISSPEAHAGEADLVHGLFERGLGTFHLRKNQFSTVQLEECLRQIRPEFYPRIVIHGHFQLTGRYNLKGIHLKGQILEHTESGDILQLIRLARKRRLGVSGSFHSIESLKRWQGELDYAFLGPVFHSISKTDYPAQISLEEARTYLQEHGRKGKVVALGGIDESNILEVRASGFDGAALLGSIWLSERPVDKFKTIHKLLRNEV
jgi:thiamine-phosphate pyrophosphorylase